MSQTPPKHLRILLTAHHHYPLMPAKHSQLTFLLALCSLQSTIWIVDVPIVGVLSKRWIFKKVFLRLTRCNLSGFGIGGLWSFYGQGGHVRLSAHFTPGLGFNPWNRHSRVFLWYTAIWYDTTRRVVFLPGHTLPFSTYRHPSRQNYRSSISDSGRKQKPAWACSRSLRPSQSCIFMVHGHMLWYDPTCCIFT